MVTVTFLGTGDAFSAGGRHQAGYLVRGESLTCLLDCGAGTLTSMKRHGLDPTVIDAIFISHLHGDHFAGIPFLLLEYLYESPRQRPLRIVGPPGTEERVGMLFRAMYKDTAARPLPFTLAFTEMQPGTPLTCDGAGIEPFRVPHQETEISLALRMTVDRRRILYSGDSGWTEELVSRSADTDLFICECSYFDTRLPIHLDYPRIAEQRSRFGTRRLVLTHIGREVLARRAEVETELATDGLAVQL